MSQSSALYVELDVHKDSIESALAEVYRPELTFARNISSS
jgi:hypothetical protein